MERKQYTNITIHWTHKIAIKRLFKAGFGDEELAIMYKVGWPEIKRITYRLKRGVLV